MSELVIALKGRVGGFDADFCYTGPAEGITAIWGASGSGKTTLLRAIAGLLRLEGTLCLGDTVWQDSRLCVPPHRRGAGMVFQDASLFPHLDVAGNLDFARHRNGGAPVDYDGIVDLLDVRPLLGRGVYALSGGERQRVALARTLFSAPRLLLMDEPLSSLDRRARAEILPLIRQMSAEVPILYVSHDAGEIAALADRKLTMDSGRLTAAAPPQSCLDGLSEAEVRALAAAALAAGLCPEE